MSKVQGQRNRKKQAVAEDVLSLARERLRVCFDRFDHVCVSFSGGKDSTACLNLALEAAREAGRLPLDVYHFDEEAIPPQTVEYCHRIAANPDIAFRWFCLPIAHRNACSRTSPQWYPWAPEDRPRWVRDLPPGAITEEGLPGFTRTNIADLMPVIQPPSKGRVCSILGIRCQESMTRYGAIASRDGFEAFLVPHGDGHPHITKAYPIYDWGVEDCWRAAEVLGWDYNRAYDLMEAVGLSRFEARCSPPYGEQPIRRLWAYKQCWPELWAKMTERVPGAATAARYANTELYGIAVNDDDLPPGKTWLQHTHDCLKVLEEGPRQEVAYAMTHGIRDHKRHTSDPIPDAEPHPVSGYSWKGFFVIVAAGGNKFQRQQQKVLNKAIMSRRRAKGE